MEVFADLAKLEEWVFQSLQFDPEQGGENCQTSTYHAISRGILVDLLVAKTDGRRARDFIREEITEKLGVEHVVSAGCTSADHTARLVECEHLGRSYIVLGSLNVSSKMTFL
jgi:CubicO group peptidase (beta-lactamase class C family)